MRVGMMTWICVIGMGIGSLYAQSSETKRCDLRLNSTPDPGANSACLDLIDSAAGGNGAFISTAGNVTRIAHDSLRFCKNAFQVTTKGAADIVFIMDNTGSMQYGDPHFCSTAGDPTFYRDDVIKRGMERERDTASSATAGFISFKGPDTSGVQKTRLQPLLNISKSTDPQGTINLATLESKIIADSGRKVADTCNRNTGINTDWYPSFNIALGWFNDTSLSKTHNQAIVLISDGAVSDFAKVEALAMAGKIPPVYGIHLGDSLDNQGIPSTAFLNLKELSSITNGKFFRIPPKDTIKMREAMDTIIFRLVTRVVPPQAIQIQNKVTGQMSRAILPMVAGSDGNLNVNLDSALALKQDTNQFNVIITLGDGSQRFHSLRVLANGAPATLDTGHLKCYSPATLTMLATSGQTEVSFPAGPSKYSLKLTRSPSEQSTVTVKASALKGPVSSDVETIPLPLSGVSSSSVTNQNAVLQNLNGSSTNPVSGNGTVEADIGEKILFSWVHPRDPRDTASDLVDGVPGAGTLDRLISVAHGVNFSSAAVAVPVVIRGAVGYTVINKDSTQIHPDSTGACIYNCTDGNATYATSLFPAPAAPSFVLRTDAPFSFSLYIFDNLGRFVNKASGSIDAAQWQTLKPDATGTVPVVLSLVPIGKNGQLLASGVYVLKATVTSVSNSGGAAVTRKFKPKQFGYLRP